MLVAMGIHASRWQLDLTPLTSIYNFQVFWSGRAGVAKGFSTGQNFTHLFVVTPTNFKWRVQKRSCISNNSLPKVNISSTECTYKFSPATVSMRINNAKKNIY